jgi:hypothetical protein
MKEVLGSILPRLLPEGVHFLTVPHEGKSDLEQSIPRKLRAWRVPRTRFVIVRDNDGGDCRVLKQALINLCHRGGRPDSLVRIACQELESWFLGDLAAVDASGIVRGSRFSRLQNKRKYRETDQLDNAKEEFRRLVPNYRPIGASRVIAPHLSFDNSRSMSFQVLLSGVMRFARE